MQLYLVVCEVDQKKHVKRIYKSQEECLHYLDSIFNEIQNSNSENYRIINYDNNELVLGETTDNLPDLKGQRRYSIVSGEITEMLTFWADIINGEQGDLL